MSGDAEVERLSTRERLLRAALEATTDQAFTNLSLRKLTKRVGIVPTGFYRHFPDMDELGLTLVDDAFGTLHQMLRGVREDPIPADDMIRGSVEVLVEAVRQRPEHFRFIVREMNGGSTVLRAAIEERLADFTTDLCRDVARLPLVKEWHTRDQLMFADLIVTVVVSAASRMLAQPDDLAVVAARTEQQLRLVVLAIPHWDH